MEKGKDHSEPGDFQLAYARETARQLIAQLERGTSPYQKSWAGESLRLPYNPKTGTRYQGINALKLLMQGRSDCRWLTLRQINELGGRVRRGEHGVRCFYFAQKMVPRGEWLRARGRDEEAAAADRSERVRVLIPCPFTVFNAEQTESLELDGAEKEERAGWTPVERAEQLLRNSGAVFRCEKGDRACYNASEDVIVLPLRSQFAAPSEFYDAALHELGHWTGHESRLNRFTGASPIAFGSPEYAKEELRAETASLMVAAQIGLPHHLKNHASYIAGWVGVLRDDPKELLRACSDAQRITDYLLQYDREQVWVVNYDRRSAFREDADQAIRRCEAFINEHALLPERFRASVVRLMGEKSIVKRDAEWEVARQALSPDTNGPILERSGLKGIALLREPHRFISYARAADAELGEYALRQVRRALGPRRAESALRRSMLPESRTAEAGLSARLRLHFARAGQNSRDALSKLREAPSAQQREALEKAREEAGRSLGLALGKERRKAPEAPRKKPPQKEISR